MHRITTYLLALASLVFVTSVAQAHARLVQSSPRVGGTVESAPHEVTLSFTEKLEPAFSHVEVRDSEGKRVDTGRATVSETQMSITVKPLKAGTYRVYWHALSVDTHTSEGRFSFHVGGGTGD